MSLNNTELIDALRGAQNCCNEQEEDTNGNNVISSLSSSAPQAEAAAAPATNKPPASLIVISNRLPFVLKRDQEDGTLSRKARYA